MKRQFRPMLQGNMEFELIQINSYGASFGFLIHLCRPHNLIEKKEDFIRTDENLKNLTVITVRNSNQC